MRVLVIDQCSGSKEIPEWFTPYTAEEIDSHSREELLNNVRDRVPSLRAAKLYTGRQQRFITEACDRLRRAGDTVDRVFVSAGFGVVDEEMQLPPYEVTFKEYADSEIRARGDELGIGPDLQELLQTEPPYEIVFIALGNAYLESFDVSRLLSSLPATTVAVLFNGEELASEFEQVRTLPARTDEAKRFGTIVVAVKGQYLKHFAGHRAKGKEPESPDDIVSWCETPPSSQATLGDEER